MQKSEEEINLEQFRHACKMRNLAQAFKWLLVYWDLENAGLPNRESPNCIYDLVCHGDCSFRSQVTLRSTSKCLRSMPRVFSATLVALSSHPEKRSCSLCCEQRAVSRFWRGLTSCSSRTRPVPTLWRRWWVDSTVSAVVVVRSALVFIHLW